MHDQAFIWKAWVDEARRTLTAEAVFDDADRSGSRADTWNWKLAALTEAGEEIVASAEGVKGENFSSWTVPLPVPPAKRAWLQDAQGRTVFIVYMSTVDSDGQPHSGSREATYDPNAKPGARGLAKAAATGVKVSARQIGASIAMAKATFGGGHDHYMKMSYMLGGDPEMPVWTELPSKFTSVKISGSTDKRSIRVITGTDGATICLKHNGTAGGDYFRTARFVSEFTFDNVDANDYPLLITITKDNSIPFQSQINSDLSMGGGLAKVGLVTTTIPFTIRASTVGETNKFDVSGSDGADKAYNISLPSASVLDLTLCASYTNFDAKLEIFGKDKVGTGYYNDDNAACAVKADYPIITTASLKAGDYFIVVDGYNGLTGQFELKASYSGLDGQAVPGFPFFSKGSNAGKGNNWDVRHTDGDDMAYTFRLSHASHLDFSTCATGTGFDSKMEIFRADRVSTGYYSDDFCGINSRLNDVHLPAGDYVLAVDGYNGTVGSFDLSMRFASDHAIASLPYYQGGTTSGRIDDWDVAYTDGEDVSFLLTLDASATVDITTCSPELNYDSKVEVFRVDGTSTGHYSDDDGTCPYNANASTLRGINLEKGQYLIVVDGYNSAAGNYALSVQPSPVLQKSAVSAAGPAWWSGDALDRELAKSGRGGLAKVSTGPFTAGGKTLYDAEKEANEGRPVVKAAAGPSAPSADTSATFAYEVAKGRRLAALAIDPVRDMRLTEGWLAYRLHVPGSAASLDLELLDLSGRVVWSHLGGSLPGDHSMRHAMPPGLKAGTYLCKIRLDGRTFRKALVLMR